MKTNTDVLIQTLFRLQISKTIASILIKTGKDWTREDLQYISQDKKEFIEEDLLKTLKN